MLQFRSLSLCGKKQLLEVIDQDQDREYQTALGYPDSGKKPWVPDQADECQYKCCHRCRPALLGRSYLSLNGIVEGEIPTTAVTGFGFHHAGARPVMDVDIVKNLGCRSVPWVCLTYLVLINYDDILI